LKYNNPNGEIVLKNKQTPHNFFLKTCETCIKNELGNYFFQEVFLIGQKTRLSLTFSSLIVQELINEIFSCRKKYFYKKQNFGNFILTFV